MFHKENLNSEQQMDLIIQRLNFGTESICSLIYLCLLVETCLKSRLPFLIMQATLLMVSHLTFIQEIFPSEWSATSLIWTQQAHNSLTEWGYFLITVHLGSYLLAIWLFSIRYLGVSRMLLDLHVVDWSLKQTVKSKGDNSNTTPYKTVTYVFGGVIIVTVLIYWIINAANVYGHGTKAGEITLEIALILTLTYILIDATVLAVALVRVRKALKKQPHLLMNERYMCMHIGILILVFVSSCFGLFSFYTGRLKLISWSAYFICNLFQSFLLGFIMKQKQAPLLWREDLDLLLQSTLTPPAWRVGNAWSN